MDARLFSSGRKADKLTESDTFRLYREKADSDLPVHEKLLYGSDLDQQRRFDVALDLLRPFSHGEVSGAASYHGHRPIFSSVLDVGCGLGCLLGRINRCLSYTGIDPVESFIRQAQQKWTRRVGDIRFLCTDLDGFLEARLPRHDFVIASGVELGETHDAFVEFVGKLWSCCNRAVVFNGLSSLTYKGSFEATSPFEALEVALSFTQAVTLVHMPDIQVFTILMVRTEEKGGSGA